MNVLLVTLGTKANSDAVDFWRTRLGDRGELFVLRVCGMEQSRVADDYLHDLDQILFFTEYRRWPKKALEISFRNLGRLRQLIPQLTYPCSLLLWNGVLRFRWRELVCDLQSFEPDVVDLRWIPESVTSALRLSGELRGATVVSGVEVPSKVEFNDSWRKYDRSLKVSIVLPVYNGAHYLHESIESCLNQTHRNLELLLVDDCSTDQTPEIIKEYAESDDRIISIRNESNLHLPGSLNVGFRYSTGHLLTWTSDDNWYAPGAIEALARQISSTPDVGLVYSAFRHIDERGRVDPRIVYLPPPSLLPFVNSVGPSFLYRREVYETIGDYNEKAEYREDYEYWLRVSKQFRLKRIHIPLYYYRRNPESMTAKMKAHPEIVRPSKIHRPS